MSVKMIVAINDQNIIGLNNKIPWFYPEDLKFFRKQTEEHVVVMGRNTWESLPTSVRPLPNRVNIVVISSTYEAISIPNPTVEVVRSLSDAVSYSQTTYPDKIVWLVGGARIYAEGLLTADMALVTNVPDKVRAENGLVVWPGFPANWDITNVSVHPYCPRLQLATWKRTS